MVVFTCSHCGESVQKPKVEKHYLTKCRNKNPNLSCMDCFKDFLGPDYEAHTKCITEEERYSGKGFIAKEKKGEKKQTAWVEILQSVLDEQKTAPQNVRRIIETISKHNNTPRKKPKFINFVKNVCGHKTNPKDMDQAWELISVKLTELSIITQNQNKKNTTNGETVLQNGEHNKENSEDDKENNVQDNKENETKKLQNGDTEAKNEEDETVDEVSDVKKLSKKQRKEEKKRQKYEAELQSAEAPLVEEEVENEGKKGKKKKNRTESQNGEVEETAESKKQKKRKRQDTVNSLNGATAAEVLPENNITKEEKPVEKTKKKKKKGEEADESVCLHDQNVAKIEEASEKNGKFNWHAVIMSVLQKKDNEVPFKRLQKKVLAEYSEATGQDIDDRIADKFIKKLKSAPNVRVDKNRVLLIE